MPGATEWALISNQYIDCTQPGQIPGFARRLGSDTIAYSISEAAFTIQFGSYQPPPILYLDFAWLSRNRTSHKRKELGYSRRRIERGERERERERGMVNLIACHQSFVSRRWKTGKMRCTQLIVLYANFIIVGETIIVSFLCVILRNGIK